MEVRAVLFDLGNTLVSYYRSDEFPLILRECLRSVATAAGLGLTQVAEEEMFQHALTLNREHGDHAVRPLDGRIRKLFQHSVDLDQTKLADGCRAFLAPIFHRAKLDPEAIHVLGELRRLGIKTAVVSNTPWGSSAVAWREELNRHGLVNKVDAVVFCVDVGWRKPHPAPFRKALELLSVASSEAVFVGDDPRWDIIGAERAGVRPILLSPDGSLDITGCTVVRRLREVLDVINTAPNLGAA